MVSEPMVLIKKSGYSQGVALTMKRSTLEEFNGLTELPASVAKAQRLSQGLHLLTFYNTLPNKREYLAVHLDSFMLQKQPARVAKTAIKNLLLSHPICLCCRAYWHSFVWSVLGTKHQDLKPYKSF